MSDYLRGRPSAKMSELAPIFDELTFWSSRFGSLLFDNLDRRKGIVGLDLGCATGFPLIELAMSHGPASRFLGVDLWEEGLEVACRKIAFHGIYNAAVVRADAGRLPCSDRSVDLVVSNLGLNNFESPGDVLRECHRVTRDNGRLVLTTNTVGTMASIYELSGAALDGTAPDAAQRLRAEAAHRGTVDDIFKLVEAVGYSIVRIVEDRFEMKFTDGSAALRHGLMAWFIEGWRHALGPEIEEVAFGELERNLNDIALETGQLSLSVPALYLEAQRFAKP